MSMDFQKQVILITGASSGIGKEVAIAFGRLGATLVLSDVNENAGEELADQISNTHGVEARFFKADVSSKDDVESLFDSIRRTEGRLDCAVNNAGIEQPICRTGDCEIDWAQRCFDVNLLGVFLCMKHELNIMTQQAAGSIVNVASVAGIKSAEMASVYSASKHGVIGLTRSSAAEYADKNIRINAVCPGATNTDMINRNEEKYPGIKERLRNKSAMKRIAEPEEIADSIVWLSNKNRKSTTGHALIIDGAESA